MSDSIDDLSRPKTLKELARQSETLEEFGYNLRDWQHEIARLVTSRSELTERLREAPRLLAGRFADGDVADAYLAAYAEWLAENAGVVPPKWVNQETRVAGKSWYSDDSREQLESLTPYNFSRRGLYTIPDNIFKPRRGRPRVSEESKRLKALERQRAYRRRVKALVDKARAAGL